MKVLAVFAHPRRDSISGAVVDLYRENFESRFQLEDLAQFHDKPMPRDVLFQQERIDQADALVFALPI